MDNIVLSFVSKKYSNFNFKVKSTFTPFFKHDLPVALRSILNANVAIEIQTDSMLNCMREIKGDFETIWFKYITNVWSTADTSGQRLCRPATLDSHCPTARPGLVDITNGATMTSATNRC